MQKLCEPNIEKVTFYIEAMPVFCKDNGFLRTLHICCDNSFMLK